MRIVSRGAYGKRERTSLRSLSLFSVSYPAAEEWLRERDFYSKVTGLVSPSRQI